MRGAPKKRRKKNAPEGLEPPQHHEAQQGLHRRIMGQKRRKKNEMGAESQGGVSKIVCLGSFKKTGWIGAPIGTLTCSFGRRFQMGQFLEISSRCLHQKLAARPRHSTIVEKKIPLATLNTLGPSPFGTLHLCDSSTGRCARCRGARTLVNRRTHISNSFR